MECKVRDISMHYEEVGTGRPLVVLHGWGLNGRMTMGDLEPAFADRPGWRRLYVDMPGHGQTLLPDWLHKHDDLVDILLEFMDAAAPGERFTVAGISWGGYLARGIAHHRPKQVDGVLMVVTGVILDREARTLPEHHVIRQDPAFTAALHPEEDWMASTLVVQTTSTLETIRTHFLAYETVQDPLAERLYSHPYTFNADTFPEPCPAPALILTGRQDHIVGYRDAMTILDNFPRATYAVLDRAGHMLSAEQPKLTRALMDEWLDRVEEYVAGNER